MNGTTQLINEHQLAAILCKSVRTIRKDRLVGRGIPFRKIGRLVRYAMSDVEAEINASLRRSTSDPGPERNHAV